MSETFEGFSNLFDNKNTGDTSDTSNNMFDFEKMSETFANEFKDMDMNDEETKQKFEKMTQDMQEQFKKMNMGDGVADEFFKDLSNNNGEMPDFSKIPGMENMPDFSKMPGMENMPNPENIQEHIKEMLNGKLGRLAQDIAAETAQDFDLGLEEEDVVGNVFEKMVKNPAKLLNLVKTIGTKID